MTRRTFFWMGAVLAAGLLLAPAPAAAEAQDGAGSWFQVCTCLGDRAAAEDAAAQVRGRLPGLRTMLVPVHVAGAQARRVLYELHVLHPELDAAGVCTRLGLASCPGGK